MIDSKALSCRQISKAADCAQQRAGIAMDAAEAGGCQIDCACNDVGRLSRPAMTEIDEGESIAPVQTGHGACEYPDQSYNTEGGSKRHRIGK